MLALLRTLSFRYLARRWDRAALIALSIALGVATLVSTRVLMRAIDAAADAAIPQADADLFVTNGEAGVALELATALRSVAGVRTVRPLLFERVRLVDLEERTAVLLGVDRPTETMDRLPDGVEVTFAPPWVLLRAALSGRAVFVGRELAADLDARHLGNQSLRVRGTNQVTVLYPAGSVGLSGKATALGRNLLVMDATLAAQLLGRPGIVSRIDLLLHPDADRAAVRAAVDAALQGRALVQEPEQFGQASREVLVGAKIGFSLCGIGALIVGLFLVYNALSVGVAERRHDIGILRSLGATRGQVGRLFAAEAALLGFIGSLLGVPLGWLLGHFALDPMQRLLGELFATLTPPSALPSVSMIVQACLTGTGSALLAAIVPALQAASDPPADAVRRTPSTSGRFLRVVQGSASFLLVAAGLGLILARTQLPPRLGSYLGMTLALIGLLLATPLLAVVLARLLRPVVRNLLGIEARIAADNLLRSPGRTGIVVGALASGVGLVVQVAGVGRSNEEPVLTWLRSIVTADLFVMGGGPNVSGSSSVPLEAAIGEQIRARTPYLVAVMPVRFRKHEYAGTEVLSIALDAAIYHEMHRQRSPSTDADQFAALTEPGTALVSRNFAALHRISVGESIRLPGPRGPVSLRVVGIVTDYSWNRGTIYLDRASYVGPFDDALVDVFDLFLTESATASERQEAEQAVRAASVGLALEVLNREQLWDFVSGLVRRLYALAYAQVVVVGIVAGLGVVMALLISVLQRQREIGLLRAAGATRGQVLRSVLAEAGLVGLIGFVLGLAVGIPMEWFVVRVVIFEESGFDFPVLLPWRELGVIGGGSVVLATLAGLWPAWLATRLNIAEAVAYE